MDYQKLELRLAELEKALYHTRTNKYSDGKKTEYHDKVVTLVHELKKCSFKSFKKDDLELYRIFLEVIFQWVEFLDNSTLNLIPFEIVSCLNKVLEEWIDDFNDYIILTSLTNKLEDYSFQYIDDADLAIFIRLARDQHNINFDKKLIQINLPRYLVYDNLANVVLYHEIGHFIETKYAIVKKIFDQEPHLKALKPDEQDKYKSHYREFFADIFAAQYVGTSSNQYLSYVAYEEPESDSHPSTEKRIETVDNFLAGKDVDAIPLLKKATKEITGRELQIRYKTISKADFENLIPYEIKEDAELHSLFMIGWEMWMDEKCALRTQFGSSKTYSIINNLIEKSISNYLISALWNKHYVPD